MPIAVDGSVTGALTGLPTLNGNIASVQGVSGELTTPEGGTTEIYWASTYTDTFADLQAAYLSGKQLLLRDSNQTYTLAQYDGSDMFLFSTVVQSSSAADAIGAVYIKCTSERDWTGNQMRVVSNNYSYHYNKPSINGETLSGDKTASDLGLAAASDVHNIPSGGNTGDIMIKNSSADFDAGWTPPANAVEQDNTLPITSAAVYTEIGNINALLATI